jgi:hypothetical protein
MINTLNKNTFYLIRHEDSGLKKLAKAVLTRAFLDSVGHVGSRGSLGSRGSVGNSEVRVLIDQANNFINSSKETFRVWCDMADTEPDYIVDLHNSLTYHYNCGKLKKFSTKYIIDRLFQKL